MSPKISGTGMSGILAKSGYGNDWVVIGILCLLFLFHNIQVESSAQEFPLNKAEYAFDSSVQVSAHLYYSISPLAQFNKMIREIKFHILDLKKQRGYDKARQLQDQLSAYQLAERGEYGYQSKSPEVHVVGFYEASGDHTKTAPAFVKVTYTGAPIILVLTAYESVEWNVDIGDGVKIERVILGGYKRPKIRVVPNDIPISDFSRRSHESIEMCFRRRGHRFKKLVESLHEITQHPVVSFQGDYRFQGTPIVIGPEESAWRLQHMIARMTPMHQSAIRPRRAKARNLADLLEFQAAYAGETTQRFLSGNTYWGQFTANGPILKTMTQLPKAFSHVARDTKNDGWYGIAGHSVMQIHPDDGRSQELEIPNSLPKLSWPCGLAFDTKRGRLLLCSLGGEGYLYSFDPSKREWSLLSSVFNVDISAMTYSRVNDQIVAISGLNPGDDQYRYVLFKFNKDGKMIAKVRLGDEIRQMGHMPNCQLIALGEKIVLLAPEDDGPRPFRRATRSYVLDLETGQVEYSTELKPR